MKIHQDNLNQKIEDKDKEINGLRSQAEIWIEELNQEIWSIQIEHQAKIERLQSQIFNLNKECS